MSQPLLALLLLLGPHRVPLLCERLPPLLTLLPAVCSLLLCQQHALSRLLLGCSLSLILGTQGAGFVRQLAGPVEQHQLLSLELVMKTLRR
jgi:hypothetical protein